MSHLPLCNLIMICASKLFQRSARIFSPPLPPPLWKSIHFRMQISKCQHVNTYRPIHPVDVLQQTPNVNRVAALERNSEDHSSSGDQEKVQTQSHDHLHLADAIRGCGLNGQQNLPPRLAAVQAGPLTPHWLLKSRNHQQMGQEATRKRLFGAHVLNLPLHENKTRPTLQEEDTKKQGGHPKNY